MAEAHAGTHDADHAGDHAHHPNYVRIWAILVALLVVSVLGPMLEIRAVTLLTAFGIAVVKAYMVVKNFMHITLAKRYVTYLVVTMLVFMLLLFAGTAPDVMQDAGSGWAKTEQWQSAHAAGPAGHQEELGEHGDAGHGEGAH